MAPPAELAVAEGARPAAAESTGARIAGVVAPSMVGMALGAWLDGPALWAVAALLAIGVAGMTVASLEGIDERGVPIESALLPAAAAAGGLGAFHLVGLSPTALVAAGAGGALVALSLLAERAALRAGLATDPVDGVTQSGTWRVLATAVPVTFFGVVGAIGLAGRAFVAGLPAAGAPNVAGAGELLVVVVGVGLVAAAAGYRIGSTDTPELHEVLWMAAGYGLLAVAALLLLRAVGVPLLSWPGVLTAVVYLWGAYHRVLDPVDTGARRLLDALVVIGAIVIAAAAHLDRG